MNIFTSANQIATTKIMLIAYQKIRCTNSKIAEPEINRIDIKRILRMFRRRRERKEMRIILILLGNFMLGTERLRIRRR